MTIELSEDVIEAIADAVVKKMQQPCEDMGEVSDGYHTFNQLYHQRAVLFATIVNEHPDISWKSFKHFDGHYCFDEDGEMFIVGIDTPEGSYTYHYHKKYWDLFKCKELEHGKEWDGHTEKDVTRLLSLEPKSPWISIKDRIPEDDQEVLFRFKDRQMGHDVAIFDCIYGEAIFFSNSKQVDIEAVTDWMPIPKHEEDEKE